MGFAGFDNHPLAQQPELEEELEELESIEEELEEELELESIEELELELTAGPPQVSGISS